MRRRWWRWIGVELMVRLFERRLLPLLLLAKDLNSILELCKPFLLFVYMVSSSFGMLGYGLPMSVSFLFLAKALNLLVNPA
jgi:hypothetical protein